MPDAYNQGFNDGYERGLSEGVEAIKQIKKLATKQTVDYLDLIQRLTSQLNGAIGLTNHLSHDVKKSKGWEEECFGEAIQPLIDVIKPPERMIDSYPMEEFTERLDAGDNRP